MTVLSVVPPLRMPSRLRAICDSALLSFAESPAVDPFPMPSRLLASDEAVRCLLARLSARLRTSSGEVLPETRVRMLSRLLAAAEEVLLAVRPWETVPLDLQLGGPPSARAHPASAEVPVLGSPALWVERPESPII